jgi:hypothetical protein
MSGEDAPRPYNLVLAIKTSKQKELTEFHGSNAPTRSPAAILATVTAIRDSISARWTPSITPIPYSIDAYAAAWVPGSHHPSATINPTNGIFGPTEPPRSRPSLWASTAAAAAGAYLPPYLGVLCEFVCQHESECEHCVQA